MPMLPFSPHLSRRRSLFQLLRMRGRRYESTNSISGGRKSRPVRLASAAAFALVTAIAITGCKRGDSDGDTKGAQTSSATANRTGGVVVTIYPLFDLTRRLAGDDIEVRLIMRPGQSPHTYNPTPADIAAVKNARLLVMNGGGIEAWIEDISAEQVKSGLAVVELTELARVDEPAGQDDAHEDEHQNEHDAQHHDAHDHSTHAGGNPHLWLVPRNAGHFAGALSEELQRLFPESADQIRERTMTLGMDIAELAIEYEDRLAPIRDRRLITFHDAFNPLADAYDLEVVATLFTFESVDVTPAAIERAVEQIRERGVAAVFIEPQMNPAAVNRLEQDVELRMLDPIGDPDRPGYTTYIELMRSNLDQLVAGLMQNSGNQNTDEPPAVGGGGADPARSGG